MHLVALPTTLAAATACAALTLARLQLGCLKLHQVSIREATCEFRSAKTLIYMSN